MVPKRLLAALVPGAERYEDVPIQIGLVRFGGISVKFEDVPGRKTMPIGRLYPSTSEMS